MEILSRISDGGDLQPGPEAARAAVSPAPFFEGGVVLTSVRTGTEMEQVSNLGTLMVPVAQFTCSLLPEACHCGPAPPLLVGVCRNVDETGQG